MLKQYQVEIKHLVPASDGGKHPSSETVYVQIFEADDEAVAVRIKEVIKAVNQL